MYRQSERNLLNSNISSRCARNVANFGPLTAEIGWRVWFRVLASLLQRRPLPEANQTLHDVWPSPRLVHLMYNFRGLLLPDGILPGANFTLPQVLGSPVLAALMHGTRPVGVRQTLRHGIQGMELRNFRRRRHLYSTGQPSRLASAHILVLLITR